MNELSEPKIAEAATEKTEVEVISFESDVATEFDSLAMCGGEQSA